MRKFLVAVFFVLCVGFATAQTGTAKPAQDSGFMSWVHDAWKTVQEQGKPAAERLVKQWPKRFQGIKQQANELIKRAHDKIVQLDLEQKKNLVIELWRMRKSLDLLTLLQPDVLQSLTGLDTSGLASLQSQIKTTTVALQAQIDPKHTVKG